MSLSIFAAILVDFLTQINKNKKVFKFEKGLSSTKSWRIKGNTRFEFKRNFGSTFHYLISTFKPELKS